MSASRARDPRVPIVISYSSSTARHTDSFASKLRALADVAGAAARTAGLDVTWVNAASPDSPAGELVAGAAGVVVLGGADVDPAMYGDAPAGAHLESTDAAADEFEIALVRAAIADDLPLFAICRGTQVLNVALGGTLVQDLPPGIHRNPDPRGPMTTHIVDVRAGTRLAGILGTGAHDIRSGHHQAVGRLADGLVVSATAPDGVVEAVELPGEAWVVGVQWHPEDQDADPAPLRALLTAFAAAAGSPTPPATPALR